MGQDHLATRNVFLAVYFDRYTKAELAHRFRVSFNQSLVRWEDKPNLHLTLGYIKNLKRLDRSAVINAFKPLSETKIFSAEAKEAIMLGSQRNSLCVLVEPYEVFQGLYQTAAYLLREHTSYSFDESYPDYIPHVKIQSLKNYLSEEQRSQVVGRFIDKCHRKFKFKVKSLALLERNQMHYDLLHEYKLKL